MIVNPVDLVDGEQLHQPADQTPFPIKERSHLNYIVIVEHRALDLCILSLFHYNQV